MKIAVIGGGLSGLSTAFLLAENFGDAQIEVFECEAKPGGTIGSIKTGEFTIETGPNGFLSSKPATFELVDKLNIASQLIEADKAAEKRFVYSGGRLVPVPDNPRLFLKSPLISLPGKLRLFMEPLIGKRADGYDETIAEFGTRRLGCEAVQKLLDPMVSGVFAGNVDKMSLQSCFPRIHELEQEYGSLVRAMFKLKSKKVSPRGRLTSFVEGMGFLIETMVKSATFKLHVQSPVTAIERQQHSFSVDSSNSIYDIVVLAIPAYALGKLDFAPLASLIPSLLNVSYPPVDVVAFALDKKVTEGFGFLIPSREGKQVLGALYNSNIFPVRANAGSSLVSVLLGGDRHHQVATYSREKIIEIAARELTSILDIDMTAIECVTTCRWPKAIPQYYREHRQLVAHMQQIERENGGVFITGNAFYGVGINDCIMASFAVANRVKQFWDSCQ